MDTYKFGHVKVVLDTAAAVLVIVVAGAILWQMHRQPQVPSPIEAVKGLRIAPTTIRNVRGTGSVVLVQFADYACPFCARHERTTAQALRKEFVDSGRIQEAFVHFPLETHVHAEKAAEAAECAAQQGQFWQMTERLYETPDRLELPELTERAESLGLDLHRFADCLHANATMTNVQADHAEGARLGVSTTPVFFIGKRDSDGTIVLTTRINGALPLEQFRGAINQLLPVSGLLPLSDHRLARIVATPDGRR